MVDKSYDLNINVSDRQHEEYLIESAEFMRGFLVLQATDYPPLESYLTDVEWSKQHEHTAIYNDFLTQLESVESSDIKADNGDIHLKMRFSYTVTLMESCLSEMLKSVTMQYDVCRRNAINNIEPLKNFKIDALSLLDKNPKEILDGLIMGFLNRTTYHQIDKVIKIYQHVVGKEISFRRDKVKDQISKLMELRHDIVHRNGKDVDGNKIYLTESNVKSYISDIRMFIEDVHNYINQNIENLSEKKTD